MKKYKVWLHIEEIDEDEDHYMDLEEHIESTGVDYNTIEEALIVKWHLIKHANSFIINLLRNSE